MGAAAGERVVACGDPGGGLLTEPDVMPEGGEVFVAAPGLEFGGGPAAGGQMLERAVPQLVQGPAGAVRVVQRGGLLEQVLRAGVGVPVTTDPSAPLQRPVF